jgi:hypothetical protein
VEQGGPPPEVLLEEAVVVVPELAPEVVPEMLLEVVPEVELELVEVDVTVPLVELVPALGTQKLPTQVLNTGSTQSACDLQVNPASISSVPTTQPLSRSRASARGKRRSRWHRR